MQCFFTEQRTTSKEFTLLQTDEKQGTVQYSILLCKAKRAVNFSTNVYNISRFERIQNYATFNCKRIPRKAIIVCYLELTNNL